MHWAPIEIYTRKTKRMTSKPPVELLAKTRGNTTQVPALDDQASETREKIVVFGHVEFFS